MKKYWFSTLVIILLVGILTYNVGKEFNKENKQGNDRIYDKDSSTESEAALTQNKIGLSQGEIAPDFELETLAGSTARLSDYRGKKVIVNLWASWCPPCKAEMPYMEKFYKENKDNNFTILAINLTSQDRGMAQVQSFVQDFGLTFPILLDKDGRVGSQFRVTSIPTSYVLDTKGIIQYKIVGPMSEDMMKDMITSID